MNQPIATNPTPTRDVHVREYWKVVWQGRWTVIAVFLLVVGVSAVWTFLQPRIYRATATIEVQPQANNVAAGRDVSGLGVAGYGWFAEEKYHNTQVEIIKSRDVAQKVDQRLGLATDSEFQNVGDRIGALRNRISAVPRRDTGLIEISMTGLDPGKVAEWVNAVADVYVERNYDRAVNNVNKAIATIRSQLETMADDYSTVDRERFDALKTSTTFSSEEQQEIIRERLRAYNADLNKTEIELSRLRDTLDRLGDLQRNAADVMSIPELAEDATLRELIQQRTKQELALESAKVELRPGHQTYQKAESELAKVRQRIQDRVSTILGTLQNRYDLTDEHANYLRREIHSAERLSVDVAAGKSRYELTKTKAETQKEVFDLIQKTVSEVQLGLQLLNNNVSVLDYATPPRAPIKPRRVLNLFVGCLFGLFGGIAVVFFLDYLDNTFRTPEEIEQRLGLSVLGLIPRMQSQGPGARAVTEAYQSLRTSVIFASKNHRRRVILVTSTGPQEGKSSTVANLARTLSAAGERVIVVDCDLRRPTQHTLHQLPSEPGLTNYLAAPLPASAEPVDTSWRAHVRSGDGSAVAVLACGPIPPSPPELLGSERFLELINSLRDAYDWVLLDSPPAATLADATLLAAASDMVLLVIRHAHTDRDLVAKAVQRLRGVNPNVAGAVLNNVDIERAYHKDYYYAGAYYYESEGAGGRSGRKRRVASKASAS